MSNESENKNLVRRWFREVWNEGRTDLIDELRSPQAVSTGLTGAASQGEEHFKSFYFNLREAFPDLHVTVHDLLASEDKVAARLTLDGTHTGLPFGKATGRKIQLDCMLFVRIANGKIVESWNSLDQFGLLKQLGFLAEDSHADFLTKRSTT
jgi:steroid delta-isomerase-like uncharacterized protein